jgi:hypothetical protein
MALLCMENFGVGLKAYDHSRADGHLEGQKLLFGWKNGYHISHNL